MPVPEGDDRRGHAGRRSPTLFHAEHRALYGYDFSGDPTQQVEWVNLRVSGIGPIPRPEIAGLAGSTTGAPTSADTGTTTPVCFDADDGYVDTPVYGAPTSAPAHVVDGPAIIEEFGSTVPLHPGFTARIDDFGNLIVRAGAPDEQASPTDFPFGS